MPDLGRRRLFPPFMGVGEANPEENDRQGPQDSLRSTMSGYVGKREEKNDSIRTNLQLTVCQINILILCRGFREKREERPERTKTPECIVIYLTKPTMSGILGETRRVPLGISDFK